MDYSIFAQQRSTSINGDIVKERKNRNKKMWLWFSEKQDNKEKKGKTL